MRLLLSAIILLFSIQTFAAAKIVINHEALYLYVDYLEDGKSFEYKICSVGSKYYETEIGLVPASRVKFGHGSFVNECFNVLGEGVAFDVEAIKTKLKEAQKIVSKEKRYRQKHLVAGVFLAHKKPPYKPGLERVVFVKYNKKFQNVSIPHGNNNEISYKDFVSILEIIRYGSAQEIATKLEWSRSGIEGLLRSSADSTR